MSNLQINNNTFLKEIIEVQLKKADNKESAISEMMMTMFDLLLEAERGEFLNIEKSIGDFNNKGNGFYSRFIKSLSGKMKLNIPRDRFGRFKPLFLEVLKHDQRNFEELAFNLYTKGLSTRDINDVLKDAYDIETSPQYISNITKTFSELKQTWDKRILNDKYYCVLIDAIHINIRRTSVDNEAIYVVLGVKEDATRNVLGIYSIPQESSSGWKNVLEDIKKRGVKDVLTFVADGLIGLENSINKVFPKAHLQKCVVHLKRNILNKVRSSDKAEISSDLNEVFDLTNQNETKENAINKLNNFINKWSKKYPSIKNMFKDNISEYYFTYLNFPFQIWRMIYTTNWIERLNKEIRKVVKNKNSFPDENSALMLIWSKIIDFEEKTYKYPITSFIGIRDKLNDMF